MAIDPSGALAGAHTAAETSHDRRAAYRAGSPRLLDRDVACTRIRALLDPDAPFPTGALIVLGSPGLGRTALLRWAATEAEELGSQVVRVRASEHETHLPYGLLRQVVAQISPEGEPSEGPWDLAEPRTPSGREAHRQAVFEALDELLMRLGQRAPLTLSIDDLHWADPASIRWLGYLARRVEVRPISILATSWAVEPTRTASALDQLLTEGSVERLVLAPLDADAAGRLVVERLGLDRHLHIDADLTQACLTATGGNPALLVTLLNELVRRLGRATPTGDDVDRVVATGTLRGLTRDVLRRARAAGPHALDVAEAILVLGPHATAAGLAAVAAVSEDEVGAALRALRTTGVATLGASVQIRTPIESAAIAGAIPPTRRRVLHERAAHHLAAASAPAGVVASHLLLVAPAADEERVRTLVRAAAQARESRRPIDARRYLHRALDEPASPDWAGAIHLDLAGLEATLDPKRAVEHLHAAAASIPDSATVTDGLIRLVAAPATVRQAALALGRADRLAHDSLPTSHRRHLVEALLSSHADARQQLRALVAATDSPDGSAARWGITHELAEVHELATLLLAHTVSLSPGTATAAELTDDITRHLKPHHLHSDEPLTRLVAVRAVLTLLNLGEHVTARRVVQSALRHDHHPSARGHRQSLLRLAARAAQEGCDLVRAQHLWHRASAANVELPPGLDAVFAAWDADLYALDEQFDAGLQLLQNRRLALEPLTAGLVSPFVVDETAGWIQLIMGSPHAALVSFRRASTAAESTGVDNPAVTSWRAGAALALAGVEDTHQAVELVSEDTERARAFGAPSPLARSLVVHAMVVRRTERAPYLREATELLDQRTPALTDLRLRLELGTLLIRDGDAPAAREVLRVAADVAQRVGADGLMTRARDLLLAAGARPRRLAMSGPDSLTPAERRTAQRAAQGLTNVQIAAELFINVKTVESHLARVFRKLGVSARTELPTVLDLRGADEPDTHVES